MTWGHRRQTALPPEAESADHGAPSGTCTDGHGGGPSVPFYSQTPLTAPGFGDRPEEGQLRTRRWRQSVVFWTGEIIAAASLFIILFTLLFIGEFSK